MQAVLAHSGSSRIHDEIDRWMAGWERPSSFESFGCSRFDVVRLAAWPDLPRLRADPDVIRLCALLTRVPTSIYLISRVLGVPAESVTAFLSAANRAGLLVVVSRQSAQAVTEMPAPAEEADQPDGIFRRLWRRFLSI